MKAQKAKTATQQPRERHQQAVVRVVIGALVNDAVES